MPLPLAVSGLAVVFTVVVVVIGALAVLQVRRGSRPNRTAMSVAIGATVVYVVGAARLPFVPSLLVGLAVAAILGLIAR